MKISAGIEEKGVIVGNTYDKYGSRNPVVRLIMQGFSRSLLDLVHKADPASIHEVGCGEGYWTLYWRAQGMNAIGTDFSEQVIALAKKNAKDSGEPEDIFHPRSIYDLQSPHDDAALLVCCEVLEHLENPEQALKTLHSLTHQHLLVSVPREPLWRILNLARGKYLLQLGNTSGHIQHWSRNRFLHMIEDYYDIVSVHNPIPWTMALCRPKP